MVHGTRVRRPAQGFERFGAGCNSREPQQEHASSASLQSPVDERAMVVDIVTQSGM